MKKMTCSMAKIAMLLIAALAVSAALSPLFAAKTYAFSDVPSGAWYEESVEYVQSRGYMIGTSDSQFSPDMSFSRAQMATVLYRLAGEPAVTGRDTFTDTEDGSWYTDAVLWASREGIVNGYGNGLFGTNDPVTQEQLLTLFWRRAGSPKSESSADNADYGTASASGVSAYARDAVAWAGETILEDAPFRLRPTAGASRAEVAYLTAAYDRYRNGAEKEMTLKLNIDGTDVDVEWEDNASVDALKALASEKTIRFNTSEYGGFEQVGSIGKSIERSDVPVTTSPGDIVLYQGNQIVLFYGSNSWRYTRLGRIKGLSEKQLEELLGGKSAYITLSVQ